MTAALKIHGRKGGDEKPRVPKEAPDNIQSVAYAKILLALGEGEFAGGITGRDIYLDGTPLLAQDGSANFPGVRWEFRPGTQHQTHIAGLPAVENELAVGLELRSDSPWVRSVVNTQLSAVRVRLSWPMLQYQKDNGDVVGHTIEYAFDVATDGGPYQEVAQFTLSGKTTTKYERTHRIDLPPASGGWQIRARRITPNQNSNRYADTMRVEAITEVIDAKLRYPNTALLYIEFDSSQFQSIPQISVETRGRVIRVPSNYDPATRTYTGIWDGTFKWAWTDNPAWVFYDIVLSERFGLGRRLKADQVDKWELYRIAQYCDQLVPDGKGGQEPRFTCNVYFQSKAEAWTVLRDLAAIFRGMSYWANNQMVALADMPRDVDYIYTRANVIDGRFDYASSPEKSRYSVAMVSYDEPDNGYQSEIEAVSDNALVRRYGVNQLDITAIGCVRRSEANRRGRWALLTNSRDRSVSFRVGLDGQIPLPGRIIGVADELLAGRPLGGRISLASGRQITLDRDAQVQPGDRLVVNLPSGKAEGRTVQSVSGRTVTVTTAYSEPLQAQSAWSVDAADLAIQQYRVMGVTQPEPHIYEITAVQHDPSKYAAIDSGARLDDRPISVIPPGVQAPPTSVAIDSYTHVSQGIAITTLRAQWEAAPGAIAYEAEWRKDDGQWVAVPRTSSLGFEVPGIYAGRYLVRVRAISPIQVASIPAYSQEVLLNGKEGAPPAVAFLNAESLIFGIRIKWGFPATGAADTERTEIQYNTAASEDGAQHLGDYPYPGNEHTLMGLAAGARLFFRARLVDRTGNIGPWSDWVMGLASTDASEILDYIAGKISETELSGQLIGRLDEFSTQIDALNAQIADIAGAPEYDPDEQYEPGNIVRYDGSIYRARVITQGNLPTDPDYWDLIGNYDSLGEAVAALALEVNTLLTRADDADDELLALATRVEGMLVQISPPLAGDTELMAGSTTVMAGVWSEQYARVKADEALAERIDTVVAQIGDDLVATVEETKRVVADLEDGVSAMYSIKLDVTQDGRYYAAGMAMGIENTPAGMQSQVLFHAGRFGIIDLDSGSVTTPFVVENGQTLINEALINEAVIQRLIMGLTLESEAVDSEGRPLISINFKTGQFMVRGETGNIRTEYDNMGARTYQGNQLRVRWGIW